MALVSIPGCFGSGEKTPPPITGETLTVRADPGLMLPVLRFAAARNGVVVTTITERDDGSIKYGLMTVRDEPGRMVATPDGDGRWTLDAEIGRFGDAQREAQLLGSFRARLAAMKKAGY